MELDYQDRREIETLLLGRKVTKVDDETLALDNGVVLTFHGNEGCPGCSNGQYVLTELNGTDNIITKVELQDPDMFYPDGAGLYSIFVFADNKRINLVGFEGDDGNGYYGTGYTITVSLPGNGDS